MEYNPPQPLHQPSKERIVELFAIFTQDSNMIDALWKATSSPYYGWKKFEAAYKADHFDKYWKAKKVSPEEAWFLLDIRRSFGSIVTEIVDTKSKPFRWTKLPSFEKLFRDFDMKMGGNMSSEQGGTGLSNNQRFLRQSLIEEAIASSQLEGAATTRERAKKMFAENRRPMSNGEWMIYNNYQVIKKIEEETSKYPLSKEALLNLHTLMTANTDLDKEKIGRWRKDSDRIVLYRLVGSEELIAFVPPEEKKIETELDKLITFANEMDDEREDFVHPIVKAILLHFWFAYIHPFCDGNGRLSRSIFYWYLIRQGYWLTSYVPISTVIRKSPAQYADAFSFSEHYGNDLTYFIDYNLRKLQQALIMFEQHVERVKKKAQEIDSLLPDKDINSRQKQVLHYLLGKPQNGTTAKQHAQFHDISWLTASQDLKALHRKGYIISEKKGVSVVYSASDKLKQFIE